MKTIYLVLFFLCLTVAVPVQAATYWVSGSLGSAGNCGNSVGSSPPSNYLRTVAAGIACLSGGDTLNIRAGTYSDGLTDLPPGPNSSTRTTVQAYNNETVTITGETGNGDSSFPERQLNLIIRGFIFDGAGLSPPGTVYFTHWSGGNVLFENNTILCGQCRMGMILHGNNSVIRNNVWHDGLYAEVGGPGGNFGYAIYVSGDSQFNVFDHNEFYNIPSYSIHMNGDPTTENRHNTISNNYFHEYGSCNPDAGNRDVGVPAIVSWMGGDHLIYNNIAKCGDFFFQQQSSSTGNVVVNNTVYNMLDGDGNGFSGIQVNADTIVKNNIFKNITGSPFNTTTANVTNNLCPSAGSGCSQTGDPLFQSATPTVPNDFKVQSGSPAINQGTDLGTPYNFDFAGTFRPQGAGWDMGAFEFASIVPLPTVTVSLPISGCTTTSTSPKACTTSNATLTITGTSSLP